MYDNSILYNICDKLSEMIGILRSDYRLSGFGFQSLACNAGYVSSAFGYIPMLR